MATDEEKTTGSQHYLTGFGSLVHFIASDRDHSASSYKTFDSLAARDLLYHEAELLELEALQEQYDREDASEVDKAGSLSPKWLKVDRTRETDCPSSQVLRTPVRPQRVGREGWIWQCRSVQD